MNDKVSLFIILYLNRNKEKVTDRIKLYKYSPLSAYDSYYTYLEYKVPHRLTLDVLSDFAHIIGKANTKDILKSIDMRLRKKWMIIVISAPVSIGMINIVLSLLGYSMWGLLNILVASSPFILHKLFYKKFMAKYKKLEYKFNNI